MWDRRIGQGVAHPSSSKPIWNGYKQRRSSPGALGEIVTTPPADLLTGFSSHTHLPANLRINKARHCAVLLVILLVLPVLPPILLPILPPILLPIRGTMGIKQEKSVLRAARGIRENQLLLNQGRSDSPLLRPLLRIDSSAIIKCPLP